MMAVSWQMWRTLDVSGLCLVAAATLREGAVIPTTTPRGMTETRLFLKETKNMFADLFGKSQGIGQNQLRFAMKICSHNWVYAAKKTLRTTWGESRSLG
jgi:hypothetical protein